MPNYRLFNPGCPCCDGSGSSGTSATCCCPSGTNFCLTLSDVIDCSSPTYTQTPFNGDWILSEIFDESTGPYCTVGLFGIINSKWGKYIDISLTERYIVELIFNCSPEFLSYNVSLSFYLINPLLLSTVRLATYGGLSNDGVPFSCTEPFTLNKTTELCPAGNTWPTSITITPNCVVGGKMVKTLSTIEKLQNFTTAIKKRLENTKNVSDEQYRKRLAVCNKCPNRNPNWTCKLCGCHLNMKAKWATETCPEKSEEFPNGRWPLEIVVEEKNGGCGCSK